ncbi:MAG: 30S ribosomal protein S4 [Candidatus Hadarchaeales archaeon]
MRRIKKKYETPRHPWDKARMDAEDKLLRTYGLRRKREIWRAQTVLRKFRAQARELMARSDPQAEKEKAALIRRLQKFGLVGENATLDDVLGLTVEDIIQRYLQWIVYKKGLARTPKQARQMIVHGHVKIGGRAMKSPSYMVPVAEEDIIEVTLPLEKIGKGAAVEAGE